MKLFHKTLLFFIGVIAFQSILTILLITNVTGRANLADARRELDDEASILYDGFNSWKRQIWKSLIGIGNDRRLSRTWSPPRHGLAFSRRFWSPRSTAFLKRPAAEFRKCGRPATDLDRCCWRPATGKPHPYLELAPPRHPLPGRRDDHPLAGWHLDVYLLKRLDAEFCAQLTLNRRSLVVLLLGPPARRFLPTAGAGLRSADDAERLRGTLRPAHGRGVLQRGLPETRPPGQRNRATSCSSARSSPTSPTTGAPLAGHVLLVSPAGALLTLVLSLFLSRNITHPIADRLRAWSGSGRRLGHAGAIPRRLRDRPPLPRLQRDGPRAAGSRTALAGPPSRDRAAEGIQREDRRLHPRGDRHRQSGPRREGQPRLPGCFGLEGRQRARRAPHLPGHRHPG